MITVWCDDTVVGEIRIERRPGFQRESTTFTYDPAWLSSARAFSISPDLPLVRGPQYPATHRSTFLAFDDAAPDRWGRRLIGAEHRRSMSEIDLLLAVPDETRQGALRFSQSGMFLAPSRQKATLHDLPTLVAAAEEFNETFSRPESPSDLDWVARRRRPGWVCRGGGAQDRGGSSSPAASAALASSRVANAAPIACSGGL